MDIQKDYNGGKRDFTQANLYQADLRNAKLSGADFTEVNLYEANLDGADFSDCDLTRANLCRANLSGANFSGANLRQANLYESVCDGTDFTGADMAEANTAYASMKKAKLDDVEYDVNVMSKPEMMRMATLVTKAAKSDQKIADKLAAEIKPPAKEEK